MVYSKVIVDQIAVTFEFFDLLFLMSVLRLHVLCRPRID